MKVAIVYDRVNKMGGAERVLLALHTLYPKAPLFTAVYDKRGAPWASVFQVHPSFLQRVPFARTHHEFFAWLTPVAFWLFDFRGFDVVISVTSAEAKNIRVPKKSLHICYCLTPTRYLWSGYGEYTRNWTIQTFFFRLWLPVLRLLDRVAARRPNSYIAISNHVKERIRTYYHRTADAIIYPPVRTDIFTPLPHSKQESYYLLVSRLVAYKRPDIVVDACEQLHVPLLVIGTGSELPHLQKRASPTTRFIDRNLTDEEMLQYYQNCRAFLFAGDEDFGIVAGEAQAAGKAVIAYKKSGVAEIVLDGKTGVLFDEQSVPGLVAAIQRFETMHIAPGACRIRAKQFSTERFLKEMAIYINKRVNQV